MPTIDAIQTSYSFLAQSQFEVNDSELTISSMHSAVYGDDANAAPKSTEEQIAEDKKKIEDLKKIPYAMHKVLDSHTSKGKSILKTNFDLILMQTDGIMISSVVRAAFLDRKIKEPLDPSQQIIMGETREP